MHATYIAHLIHVVTYSEKIYARAACSRNKSFVNFTPISHGVRNWFLVPAANYVIDSWFSDQRSFCRRLAQKNVHQDT